MDEVKSIFKRKFVQMYFLKNLHKFTSRERKFIQSLIGPSDAEVKFYYSTYLQTQGPMAKSWLKNHEKWLTPSQKISIKSIQNKNILANKLAKTL
tara:strand:+ start:100 stop:384 length:285 start_codon:yes stop_codon:yes gene_type:complete